MYQALATLTTCQQSQFTVGFDLFMGFIANKKNVEYCQPYPLNVLVLSILSFFCVILLLKHIFLCTDKAASKISLVTTSEISHIVKVGSWRQIKDLITMEIVTFF